jgi:hypothetical protein
MGLKATLQRAVKAAFKAADDVPRKCTYKSVSGEVVRDLVAGTSTRVTQEFTLQTVIFTKFSEKDIDRDPALLTDMKMLFPTQDLPVQPKQSDTVLDDVGTHWVIIKRISDPASVLTILQVRTS